VEDLLVLICGVVVFAAIAVALVFLLKKSQDNPDRISNGTPMEPPPTTGPF
jgi:hypothetical protein